MSENLPWHRSMTQGRLEGGNLLRGIASADGINVAWVTLGAEGATARVDFILEAVNSHAALVEALCGDDPEAPREIRPLSWLQSLIDDCRARGPAPRQRRPRRLLHVPGRSPAPVRPGVRCRRR